MSKWSGRDATLGFLLGAAIGGVYGHMKAGVPGAIFGALVAGGLGVAAVWWLSIGFALVAIIIVFIFLFMVYGAFWSQWLK